MLVSDSDTSDGEDDGPQLRVASGSESGGGGDANGGPVSVDNLSDEDEGYSSDDGAVGLAQCVFVLAAAAVPCRVFGSRRASAVTHLRGCLPAD